MHDHTGHEHGRRHHHLPVHSRMLATLVVTGVITVAEAVGGWLSGSLALLADAGHMLTDFLALLVAFTALQLSRKPADERRTYGYRRLEILAALANGVALVVLSGSIFYEAAKRWVTPREVDVGIMAAVALIGLTANLAGLWLLRGERENLNVRGAFLHILGDTLSSAGVVVVAGLIALTGWTRFDALISFGIAVVIVATSVSLLREVLDVLLEAAPRDIDTERVRRSIAAIEGVAEVHDLHVWTIASNMPALSAHVVMSDPLGDHQTVREAIQECLRGEYRIDHSTLQIERVERRDCGCCDVERRSALRHP